MMQVKTIENNIPEFIFDSKNNIFKINGQDVGQLINFNFEMFLPKIEEHTKMLGDSDNCKYLSTTYTENKYIASLEFLETEISTPVVKG